MRKLFSLRAPGKADMRVREAVKHEIRKYVQRERRKVLPEGFTRWEFQCKAGSTSAGADACDLKALGAKIDEVANAGGAEVYVEILAEPGHRVPSDEPPPTHR